MVLAIREKGDILLFRVGTRTDSLDHGGKAECPLFRRAFTLVEMLVAMALTLFIMVILTYAFTSALDTFSGLKGIGDLQNNLRVATSAMQADLSQDHFEGKKKLSDSAIAQGGIPREGFFFIRIAPNVLEGVDTDGLPCFRSPAGPGAYSDVLYFTVKLRGNRRESFMSYGLPNTPSTPPNNFPPNPALPPPNTPFFGYSPLTDSQWPRGGPGNAQGLPNWFGQPPDAVYQDDPNQLTYNSQWAEVAWYLVNTGSTVEQSVQGSALGTPLYALYRAQYLLVPNNGVLGVSGANNNMNVTSPTVRETTNSKYLFDYRGVSCFPNPNTPPPPNNYLYFTSPMDVATNTAIRTLGPGTPAGALGPRNTAPAYSDQTMLSKPGNLVPTSNSSLVMNNVVSFHVRVLPFDKSGNVAPDFLDYNSVLPAGASLYKGYESGGATQLLPSPPFASGNNGIKALQIIIRAWDPASQQSRQTTFIQEM